MLFILILLLFCGRMYISINYHPRESGKLKYAMSLMSENNQMLSVEDTDGLRMAEGGGEGVAIKGSLP